MKKVAFLLLVFFFSFTFLSIGSRSVYAGGCQDLPSGGSDYCWTTPLGDECEHSTSSCRCTFDPEYCNVDVSCFLPGTLVKSSQGSKKIEDIKVGDRVTSFENGKIVESKVSQIYERERDFYYSLEAGDYKVKASAEHPFYIGNNEYKEIAKLRTGDTVYVLQNGALVQKKVTSNTKVDESTPVYNLQVDNTHTFFANDFAVHNKGFPTCTCRCEALLVFAEAVS